MNESKWLYYAPFWLGEWGRLGGEGMGFGEGVGWRALWEVRGGKLMIQGVVGNGDGVGMDEVRAGMLAA